MGRARPPDLDFTPGSSFSGSRSGAEVRAGLGRREFAGLPDSSDSPSRWNNRKVFSHGLEFRKVSAVSGDMSASLWLSPCAWRLVSPPPLTRTPVT